MHVAEHSWDAAGVLTDEDLARLRRAVTRYARYAAARPGGYPEGGLGALAEIAATAAERGANPHRLHYAIRALDQLTRRMRASATTDGADRHAGRAKRAQRRRVPAPAPGLHLHFRVPRPGSTAWPPWVALDGAGNPLLVDGELVVRDAFRSRPGYERQPWVAPPRPSEAYRETLRDAFLLCGLWPPVAAREEHRLRKVPLSAAAAAAATVPRRGRGAAQRARGGVRPFRRHAVESGAGALLLS